MVRIGRCLESDGVKSGIGSPATSGIEIKLEFLVELRVTVIVS